MIRKLLPLMPALVLAPVLWVFAGDTPPSTENDVGYKIDQKLESFTLRGLEIEAALADLGKQVGVEIVLADGAVEMLPWGRQTKLSDITITQSTLRAALPQILDPLAMTYEIRDGKVMVIPTPPLTRIGRRPTWDEIDLLRRLRETECTPESIAGLKFQYRITKLVDAKAMLQQHLPQAGRGSIADMLETACGALGWVWFVEQDHVVMRHMEAQINARLARVVTARYANMPLSQILADLSEKTGVLFAFEPGLMLRLPPSTAQSYTLLLQSVSVRQALELISAETGLTWKTQRDSVYIGLSESLQEGGKSAPPRTSPYVAKIAVPGPDGSYSLEFLFRADEMPAEILEARGQMLQEMVQKVRRDVAPAPPPGGSTPTQP